MRPKVAGKGISAATLAAWQAEEDQEELGSEVPYVAYQYWVTRHQWTTNQPEEDAVDAIEQTLGPFHTMAEANVVASKEIYPSEVGENVEPNLTGWSYGYKQDADGLQTHSAEVAGVHIEAVVYRRRPTTFGHLTL